MNKIRATLLALAIATAVSLGLAQSRRDIVLNEYIDRNGVYEWNIGVKGKNEDCFISARRNRDATIEVFVAEGCGVLQMKANTVQG